MEPIRILQVVTIMNHGGLETMLMNYYRNINREKIQFDFLVHRQERGIYDNEIEGMGGKIYRLPPIHPTCFIKYTKKLNEFFKQSTQYTIVHAHLDTLSTFVLSAAQKFGVPVRIAHSHNTNYELNLKAIARKCSKLFINDHCTHRFACGREAGQWLFGNKYQDEFFVLHNAIDAQKFKFKEEIRRCYNEKLNLQNKYVIGHIGRFNKQKNHAFLIDIFHEIYLKCDNAVLVLVGNGELEKDIAQKVESLGLKNHVVFLGSRADVNKVIQAFDVFLFPSLFEGLPVTMIEAQASGLKCITSDRVSSEVKITDLVEFISIDRSSTYWAEQILKYKDGYNRRDMYYEIVKSGYDIKENVKWLEKFYLSQYNRNAEGA